MVSYTHRQKLSNTTFFGDTVFELAERNMLVMEIKYFEFYCKFYYFDEHFELKKTPSIWIIYDRVKNRWKMIQKNNEKSLQQMSENNFQLDF